MKRRTKIVLLASGIVLLGVVMLVGTVTSRSMHDKWYRHDVAREHLFVLSHVLDQYRDEHGSYPSTSQGLEPLVANEYLRKIPTDPWGNAYHYVCPGVHNTQGFDLWSNGADGREGGVEFDKDVTNWPGA